MAIQKEIWMAAIVEGLFASNSFLSKAFNADAVSYTHLTLPTN